MQHQTGELTRLKDELVRLGREKALFFILDG